MGNVYNFEEFASFGARTTTNYIGITRNGTMSFYSGFCKRNNLQSFKKCVILYDKQKKVVGIQFGGDELGENAYPVNFSHDRKMGWISATNFFKLNSELDLGNLKGRYQPEKYEDASRKNVFLINLSAKLSSG